MRKVCLIYTGGTIGGLCKEGSPSLRYDASIDKFRNELIKKLPRWTHNISWDCQSPFRRLSEDIIPDDWLKIAFSVDTAIKSGYKGIIIAHGTDTMAYSAAAISLMIQNPPIPIVFTGANKTLFTKNTDAIQNISHALLLASQHVSGHFLSFAGTTRGSSKILSSTNFRKDAKREDCFQPAYSPPIGFIKNPFSLTRLKPKIVFNLFNQVKSKNNYTLKIGIDPDVAIFELYPGFKPIIIDNVVKQGIKGVVLSGYGSGTVCSRGKFSIIPAVKRLINNRIPVFVVSQHYGSISLENYGSSAGLQKFGAIGLINMTKEVAVAKLMWVISQVSDFSKICNLMTTPIANEL
jgi:glutamyl-tRNA(Gln) amidotransferase subunit D